MTSEPQAIIYWLGAICFCLLGFSSQLQHWWKLLLCYKMGSPSLCRELHTAKMTLTGGRCNGSIHAKELDNYYMQDLTQMQQLTLWLDSQTICCKILQKSQGTVYFVQQLCFQHGHQASFPSDCLKRRCTSADTETLLTSTCPYVFANVCERLRSYGLHCDSPPGDTFAAWNIEQPSEWCI